MTSLIGHAAAEAAFVAAVRSGALHHAWLLAGPEGIGKRRFADRAALRLLAEAGGSGPLPEGLDVPESHRIAALFAAGSHPDFRALERLAKDPEKPEQDVARSIKVDQIRALLPMLATKPGIGDRRVIVIDAIDDLETSAANALLKNLEEPPQGTIFLLVSHAPGRLLPTIRSRCRLLRFEPLSDADVSRVLAGELPEASAGEIEALVRAGAGSPGRALRFAGLDLAAIEAALATLATKGDADNGVRLTLAKALGGKAAQPRYAAFLERVPAFIAEQAAARSGAALRTALDAYDAARDLARASVANSLVPETTAFEMAGLVARLAEARRTP